MIKSLFLFFLSTTQTHYILKRISSFQLIFEATVQTLSSLLASSLNEHQNRNRLTCAALLVLLHTLHYSSSACGHSCAHTISAGTYAHSILHHNTLVPISPSLLFTFPPGPSPCGCVLGHATPCYDRKSPFNEVCSLLVFRLGSELYTMPFLFTVHSI